MPNKNYFAQLSPKQKAELFNIYARGGYTSLSEIENHYNSLFNDDVEPVISIPESDNKEVLETLENDYNEQSFELPTLADYFYENPNMFDMGGDTDGDDNGVNEYISKKIAEMRARALENSRTRTMPAVPIIKQTKNDAALNAFAKAEMSRRAAEQLMSNIDNGLDYVVEPWQISSKIYDGIMGKSPLFYAGYADDQDTGNHWRLALLREAALQEQAGNEFLSGVKDTDLVNGASCIYTATDNYGPQYRQASNVRFEKNPTGFIKIPVSEVAGGDIVQDKRGGVPSHALIFDGAYETDARDARIGWPLFNYSTGGSGEESIAKKGHYVNPEDFNDRWFNAFRFVGTPADSLRWKQEYENMNKRSNGGLLSDNNNIYDRWNEYDRSVNELNRRQNDLGNGLSSLVFYYPDFDKPSTSRPVDYLPRMWEIEDNKKHELELFKNDGDKKKYNIFEDKNSFDARDKHRKSLDEFIKNNPELYGISTSDFADFLSQIAGLESSYKSDAGKGMTYSGYYGLKGGRDLDSNAQHKAAFRHLKKLFNESIVKDDINKGVELGYTPAQILAKYWNQGNRVTNYLWNNIDNTDGLGTKISDYGNNITVDMDYSNYLDDAITDDYIIINNSKSMSNAIKKARNSKMNYSNRQNYILNLNGTKDKNGNTIPLDATKVHVGDTLWLKK